MPTICRNYQVPYLAGYSKDGQTVYIDCRLPKMLTLKDGRRIETDKYLYVHETTEKMLEDKMGYKYPYAHEMATAAERKAVVNDGICWKEYQTYMLAEVKKLHAITDAVPKNLDTKPEHDTQDRVMLETIKRYS